MATRYGPPASDSSTLLDSSKRRSWASASPLLSCTGSFKSAGTPSCSMKEISSKQFCSSPSRRKQTARSRRSRVRMVVCEPLRLRQKPEAVFVDGALAEGEGAELLRRLGAFPMVQRIDARSERGAQLLEVRRRLRLLPHQRRAVLFGPSADG